MSMMSQITSLTIVCSTIYSGGDPRKHKSSASLAFVLGIHRWPVNSPHKGPVTWKMFPFYDIIMVYFHIFQVRARVQQAMVVVSAFVRRDQTVHPTCYHWIVRACVLPCTPMWRHCLMETRGACVLQGRESQAMGPASESMVIACKNRVRCCFNARNFLQNPLTERLTHRVNSLRPRQMPAIFQTTFSNAFSWMKMFEFRLTFHWILFPGVKLTIFQHWFRLWLGAVQATSHYLNQWWLN